jgi:hypothetical protein
MVVASGTAVYASDPLGPSITYSEEGSSWIGIGYFRNAMKIKSSGSSSYSVSITQNQAYLQLLGSGISFSEGGSGFLRIGAADIDDGEGFQDGFVPYGTIGMKEVWYGKERDRFKVGTVLQASYYGNFEDRQGTETVTLKSLWDVSLGVGFQWRAVNPLILYGGPVFYYGTTKATREIGSVSTSETFKTKDFVGGYAGARYSLSKRWGIELEGQYKGEFCAGASVAYSFGD